MSNCPRCNAQFTCCMADQTGKDCWCGAMPRLRLEDLPASSSIAIPQDASCYCPDCLRAWKAENDAAAQKS
ncbi:cysteine-rich CWC family protein [Undibacterium sp. TJN25]|uniref:cysteine-rich CWC family protein n=1 Tax=Undibacterium sp. TJN25 TaxID=3413056 RepID=UPI003BEFDF50